MTTGGALVSGAGAGLGREIALRLGAMGYTVHVRDAQVAQEMADRTVQQAGSLELRVNNAGVLVTGPMWEQSVQQRQLMVDVNIVSLAWLTAVPGEAVYAGTKHVVMGLRLSTMLDLRIAGLRGRRHQLHLPRRDVDADALRQARRPGCVDVLLGRAAPAG